MSLSRVREAAALATLLVFTACSDAVAPVVAKMQEIAANLTNLVTCTNSWATANSGLWSNAGMWSAGHVPTATENVCITLEGNYTVTLNGFATVNSVTVSAPGNSVKPKLAIQGLWSAFNFQEVMSRLTVTNGIDNYGFIELTSAGGTQAGAAQLFVTGGTFYNHDISSFRSLVGTGAGAGRYVQGTVINDGTMAFDVTTKGDGTFTNNALFTVATGQGLTLGGTFNQNGGTFGNDGAFTLNNGAFRLGGGAMTGNMPVLFGVALEIADETAPATLAIRGASSITGNVGAAQTLEVQGWQLAAGFTETTGSLTTATGFTNAGIIRLTSTGGPMNGAANLGGPANTTIVNTGRIEVLVGLGNVRSITASIDNRATGVVDVQQNMSYAPTGGVTTNNGLWKVAAGKRFYVQANSVTFRQNGGTLDVTDATYDHLGAATFELNGGAILGEPMVQGTLKIGSASPATGRVFLYGTNTLVGDVMHGQTLIVAAPSNGFGSLTSPASFTNRGTITLTAAGTNTGSTSLNVTAPGTITNATDGRIETIAGVGFTDRIINGNFVNAGTLHVTVRTFLIGPTIHTTGPITGGGELRNWGGTMFASGNIEAGLLNSGVFHVGQTVGAAGKVDITGYFYMYSGTLNVDIGGSIAGADYDKITASDYAFSSAALNVATTIGGCAGGGSSYEIIKAGSHSGDFSTKTGLSLGGGRTVTTVPGSTNYVLNVSGPVCVPPDITAPIIAPTVTGTLGDNGWYTSDVSVSWSVTDAESAIASSTGCGASSVTSDNAGTTFTCSATSAGGTSSQSVTIKRDATAPVVTAGRAPAANANGWNNTDVSASWSASDGMSGLVGNGTATELFSVEGANQGASRTFTDNAGNSTTASVTGISIDKTAPVVTASRAPAANGWGWNNTDVTASWTATDALSGIDGNATASQLFSTECDNDGASRTFTDLAGNSASAGVSNIKIDKTAPIVTSTQFPAANAAGWNNTDVTLTWTLTDNLSGFAGPTTRTTVLTQEGKNNASFVTGDLAGNRAVGENNSVRIDKTAPVITVTRTPLAGPGGWNNTDVTVTYSATDTLSGVVPPSVVTQLFDQNGANQGGSQSFSDNAGNSATGSITGINIDKNPPPPPPGGSSIGSATPSEIWPANNKMVAVRVTMCAGVTSYTLRSVTNNESGSADVEGWSIGTADLNGSVRATRNGGGNGRTYTLVYDTINANGAAGTCTVTVLVPHDQGKKL